MLDQDQADADAQFAEAEARWMKSVVAAWLTGVENATKAADEWQAFGDQMARMAEHPGGMLPGMPPDDPGDFGDRMSSRVPDFGLPANALPDMFTHAMQTAYTIAGVYRRHVAKLTCALVEERRAA